MYDTKNRNLTKSTGTLVLASSSTSDLKVRRCKRCLARQMDTEEERQQTEHDAMVEEENQQRGGEQYWGAYEITKTA